MLQYQIMCQNLLELVEAAIKHVIKPAVKIVTNEDPLFKSEGWCVRMPQESWQRSEDTHLTFWDIENIDFDKGITVRCLYCANDNLLFRSDDFTIPWSWINGEKTSQEMQEEAIDFFVSKMNNRRKCKRESDRRMFERLKEEYGW